MSNVVIVGKINGLYGVKGWLKIFSYTDPKENILNYTPWLINGQLIDLEDGKPQGKGIIAKLKGVDDRNQAMAFLQTEISIQREQLPILPTDEFYWSDLIGLRVINEEGIDLGSIFELFETGANDVIVVKNQNIERLIPFVWNDIVEHIDLEKREMRVRWDADF
jgi:16S rRNA processing protein RimM